MVNFENFVEKAIEGEIKKILHKKPFCRYSINSKKI
jgi:hypothetical protein